ncbi:MAG: histidine kinase [Cyclobacteriaceae bacterium]|nr:histidine kinase [Cyclobacteriaceae bacterium]
MNRLFIHQVLFRILSAPVLGVMVYLLILLINNNFSELENIFSSAEVYVCIGLAYISLEAMRLTLSVSEKWLSKQSTRRRIIVQLTATLGVSLLLITLSIQAYYNWIIGFSISMGELHVFLAIYGVIGLLYNALFFSNFYLNRENTLLIQQEKKLREKLESDFISFKNDINPDLLYESLENLILTLQHNVDKAEEQIDYLAGIYRYGLINRHKELISLEEELQAAEHLVKLLNYKYHGQLNLLNAVRDPDHIQLIPGSLLVTIDSIARNTLISKESPLVIRLYLEEGDEYLVLQHTLNDRLLLHQDSLQAYNRLKRSYSFFSENPFVQVKAGKENYIKFPLVQIADEVTTNE